MKTAQEQFDENMKDPGFLLWYHSRPDSVQELARKYPYDKYRINENAPYALTCPGSIVYLESYRENGTVRVLLKAEDKLPETDRYIEHLAIKHGSNAEENKNNDIRTYINPIYLEPIE